jgi:dihydroorotase-like cyclic amidohydrolase
MYADLIITGNIATHFGAFKGVSIAVKDGKIIGMGRKDALPPGKEELDYGELLILPGVVDPHVHSLGDAHEGFFNASYAAAAGGTTTINDHPLDIGGAPTSKMDIERKAVAASQEMVVDFSFFAAAVPEKLKDIADVADSGITGYKTLMHATSGASTYGLRAVTDAELYQIFEEIAKVDQRVMIHAENDPIQQFLEARLYREGMV